MRVAVVVKTTEGGLWIVPQVRELLARGAHVVVVLPPGGGRLVRALSALQLDADGLEVRHVAFDFAFSNPARAVRGVHALRRLLRSLDLDACLYHLYASALASRAALLGSGVRRVHMVAGPLYLESGVVRAAERVLLRGDDHLIAGSEYTARAYRAIGARGDRVTTVPYGVDVERFSPRPEADAAARTALELPVDGFVAVMVAFVYAPKRLASDARAIKGHAELLAAWQRVHARHPEARLLLVGSGFDTAGEAERRRILDGLDADPAAMGVLWLDSVDDVRDAYRAADVSVSPSLSENHGAALEASAMGVPSIVSDAGGLPETVTPESGWIVPAGEVDPLVTALEAAIAEREHGTLERRGLAARTLMLDRFAVADSARRVADIVLEDAG